MLLVMAHHNKVLKLDHEDDLLFLVVGLMTLMLMHYLIRIMAFKVDRQKVTAWLYFKYVSPHVRGVVHQEIRRAFLCMKHFIRWRCLNQVRVVEIGIGTGLNFGYYPKRTYLTAVDNNTEILIDYNENRRLNSDRVMVENTMVVSADDMSAIPNDLADVVVFTYVLCSVHNVDAVLKEVKRVLKPNGCVVFAEHTCYTDSFWKFLLQKLVSPILRLCCGFRTDLNLSKILSEHFKVMDVRVSYQEGLWIPMRPHLTGIGWN